MRGTDEGVRVPSTGKPEFVMTGVIRPGGGVRVYASRDLPGMHFGQREDGYAVAWHVDATMRDVLVIDAPAWGEAFAKLFELWENRDRAKALEETARPRKVAPLSPGERAGIGGGFEALEAPGEAAVRRQIGGPL